MAYVRRRGNQLAIVHGERAPGTGKVQQRILFTIYSKAEALEILGRSKRQGRHYNFEALLQRQHPDIKIDWQPIRRGIEEQLGALPDLYQYRAERVGTRFRADLCAFARQLMLADPQHLMASAQLIGEHRRELEYLVHLIEWRLKLRDQKPNEWNEDNPFFWRFALQGDGVPADAEEHAAGLYERGEYEQAEAVFRLLVDCFDHYAEGYNYLGLIAYAQHQVEPAIEHFQRAVEIGRKLFPARISKKRYWTDHSTRPFMRGLRNLALAMNESGRFADALVTCDRLDDECGDGLAAASQRAVIYLNTRMWAMAAECARQSGGDLDPTAGFVAAFALHELGRGEEVLLAFLHAALNRPRAARMLMGECTPEPCSSSFTEVSDQNAGVHLRRSLQPYLAAQSRAAKTFFRQLVRDARVTNLLDESLAVERRQHEARPQVDRSAFDRATLMRSRSFAESQALELHDLLHLPPRPRAAGWRKPRRRSSEKARASGREA